MNLSLIAFPDTSLIRGNKLILNPCLGFAGSDSAENGAPEAGSNRGFSASEECSSGAVLCTPPA
jgi:hypothetical protein